MEIIKRKYEHKNKEEIITSTKETIGKEDTNKKVSFQITFNNNKELILKISTYDFDKGGISEEYLFSLDQYETEDLINFVKEKIQL